LRKAEFGGYEVEKRQRVASKVLRGEDFGTVWEYQMRRAIRRKLVRARAQSGRGKFRCRRLLGES